MSKKDKTPTADEMLDNFKHYLNTSLECLSQGCRNVIFSRVVDLMEAARRDALAETKLDVESLRNEIIDEMIDRANELRHVEPTKAEVAAEKEEDDFKLRVDNANNVIAMLRANSAIYSAKKVVRKVKGGFKIYFHIVLTSFPFGYIRRARANALADITKSFPRANITSSSNYTFTVAEY